MADDTAPRIEITLSAVDELAKGGREEWNAVANPPGLPYDPFLDWDFLEALESAGCAIPELGWTPRHLLARDRAGQLIGAAPLYLKSHSRGEFVFDHAWADALYRAGGQYYPKLLCAVPFTPVPGRRLLAQPGAAESSIRQALAGAIIASANEARLSSVHFNFVDETSWSELGEAGLLLRTDQQFHWYNRGYRTFDDFLTALASRKRKMVRKERQAAQEGLTIQRLSGPELRPSHWDAFFRFYMDTGGRKWGSPYLNRRFFSLLHERMADRVLLVLAYDGGTPIAGALNMIGSEALYGRYWGRIRERPFLHFELCYYQAIEFAIEQGLARVEAGAQGDHKLARGYEPSLTRSAHWIRHKGLRDAVARYLDSERIAVSEGMDELAAYTPFRRDDAGGGGPEMDHEEEGF